MEQPITREELNDALRILAEHHTLESTQHDVGIRLAAIEDRLLNLETRRNC